MAARLGHSGGKSKESREAGGVPGKRKTRWTAEKISTHRVLRVRDGGGIKGKEKGPALAEIARLSPSVSVSARASCLLFRLAASLIAAITPRFQHRPPNFSLDCDPSRLANEGVYDVVRVVPPPYHTTSHVDSKSSRPQIGSRNRELAWNIEGNGFAISCTDEGM